MFRRTGYRPFRELEQLPESETDVALRESLRLLPVPDASPEFNVRVHAALQQPTPWWRPLWIHARPVLSGAACSLLVTLMVLKALSTTTPTPRRPSQPAATGDRVAYRTRARMNELIRSDDLNAASLSGFGVRSRPIQAKRSKAVKTP